MTEGLPYQPYDDTDPDLPYQGPLKVEGWELWLKDHPDHHFTKALPAILRKGAKIGYRGPSLTHRSTNHYSALVAPEILSSDLQKQLDHDRLVKVDPATDAPFVCSPLGLVPKHDGGWRRIHDLSFPPGNSVNDGIPQEWGSLEYTTFDEAVDALLRQGSGAVLVKRDLKDAFRHVPVATSDQWLLGFECDGSYWMERYLPFGLRTSPFLFDLFARALNWIMIAVLSWSFVLHYLDDFFAILPPHADARAYCRDFELVCSDLGVIINHSKDIEGTKADFLGIELDSILMQARLPPDKLARARNTVNDLLNRRVISRHELESAVGFLSFAAKIVIPGRAFLRRLFDAIRRPVAMIRITKTMKSDLLWWKAFLKDWNGISLLRDVADRQIKHIWTDASGKFGLGGYMLERPGTAVHEAFSTRVATRHIRKDIQFKEMQAVNYALHLWVDQLRGRRVILYCDNEACVHGLSKLSIRGLAMGPLRQIAMTMAEYDILLVPTWIPTHANQLADDLSRFRYRKIADKYPQLRHLTTPPPPRAGTHLNLSTIKPLYHEKPPVYSSGASQRRPARVTTRQSSPTESTMH